jgi:hypothetical protein
VKADYSYAPSMRMLGHSEIFQGHSEADILPLKKARLRKLAHLSKSWICASQALSNGNIVGPCMNGLQYIGYRQRDALLYFFGIVFLNQVRGTATIVNPWTTHHVFKRRSGLMTLYLALYLMVAGNSFHVFQCAYLLSSALLKLHIRQLDNVA